MTYMRYSITPTFPVSTVQDRPTFELSSPIDILRYWRVHIASDPTIEDYKEQLLVVAIDTRMNVIGHHIVSVGTVDQCLLFVRDVLRPVLVAGAKRFVLMHNHPSGDSRPSSADITVTQKLVKACEVMDLKLYDHVIIGGVGRNYYSFLEHGRV